MADEPAIATPPVVDPSPQGQALGRKLEDWSETRLHGRGCPKIDLQARRNNAAALASHAALGYADDNVVSLGKWLEHDER